MAASNTRFTQNSLGQSKTPIDSDHGIYRDGCANLSCDRNLTSRCALQVLFRPLIGALSPLSAAAVTSRINDIGCAGRVRYRNFAEALFGPSIISEREYSMPGRRMPGRHFLFVPGPTNVPDRVMRAMMVAMEDHRSSKFPELTLWLFRELKRLFKTDTGQAFIFPSSGTGGWEAALSNTLSPGDRVLAPRFGQFSHLWIDMAQRLGYDVEVLEG